MNIVTLGLAAILGKSGEPAKADFAQTGYTKFGLTYEDAAQLGLETDSARKAKAVTEYKDHLSRVIAIKTMVRADLQTAGYNQTE